MALANNPGGATLGGTLTATASDGVATFSGLTLNKAAVRLHARGLRQRPRRGRHERHHRDPRGGLSVGDHQQPPATVKLNGGFGLQASIEDPYGNVATTATNHGERRARQ